MKKKRLDVLLVERNLIDSREKAKRTIMAGLVFSNEQRLDKPGMQVQEDIPLHIKGDINPYVSRGGFKLEKALKYFNISAKDKILIDIGSSTGGFTDCALQHGAKKSYAIDVGYNQLDWKLRNDDRVIVMERTNFRYVTPDMLTKGKPNLATIDVSFISLQLILPVLKRLLMENADIVTLIKPQFEAGKADVGKGGIIKDPEIHLSVLKQTLHFAKREQFDILGLTYSPITGGEGNIEFLAHFGWQKTKGKCFKTNDLKEVVQKAHNNLKAK